MQKISCQQLTSSILSLQTKQRDFDDSIKPETRNIPSAIKLQGSIKTEINEVLINLWPLEVLTSENIKAQLSKWQAVYQEIGITDDNLQLPSLESVMDYLSDEPKFQELLKLKEKQGFVKMVISPASFSLELKTFIDKLNEKVKASNGFETYLSDTWKAMLNNEDKIRYFCTIENDQPTGGYTRDDIRAQPENFGILDGWMISFVEDKQDIVKGSEPDSINTAVRADIKTNQSAQAYQESYFSDKDPHYKGENPMIPQEWLALFADSLYTKYLKDKKQMDQTAPDLLDANTGTWLTSTSLPGHEFLQYAGWRLDARLLFLGGCRPTGSNDILAPRASVRKKN